MTGRFIYDKQKRDFVPAEEYRRPVEAGGMTVMNDIAPIHLPGGKVLSSRSALREYERTYNVRQCGNEWTGSGRAPEWFNNSRR